ncbi:M23 family metallopeptidase [Rhodococcus sp. IEGM 1408]|jgi:murein DD-endopeptidase MepM/ murein hydrolase activator NlpD|uniref:M23 family metallopeptidase n=1 Tax=Rhodococcus sp. IEGM 1408 TaxID=3082220 RepID=UPI00295567F9|nr:M23 family metallopeptidase [Rhodococcus sp. IEGM 1408]MDV8003143.1 M23 family metallopeptidase [Rhodococcus sp. IEGM 1408]HMT50459.1 M23 family metallopeptidase [Dietzia sp.]
MTDSTRPVTVAELTERLGVRSGTLAGGRHRVASENTTVSRFVGSAVVGVALSGGLGLAFAPAAAAQPAAIDQAQIVGAIQAAAEQFGIDPAEIQRIGDQFGVAPSEVRQYAAGLGLGSLGEGSIPQIGGAYAPTAGAITSGFGSRWGSFHNGTDFGAPIGTPLHAAKSGVVEAAGPAAGYGIWIRIRTDDGELLEYGHNDQNYVSVGQRVTAGEVIGTVGNRGDSTGPHLHFRVQDAAGQWVDPVPWLAAQGVLV